MSEEIPPSQAEVNRSVRVLSGKPLKYTCRVHKTDGSVIEWQSETRPKLDWNDEARALWIAEGYGDPIMAVETGIVLLTEENPK